MKGLVVAAVSLVLVAAGCGGEAGPSLSDRANVACGTDTTVSFKHDPRGFGHGESIAVTCRRPDGTIYVEVVE